MSYNKILIAADDSVCAMYAAKKGLELAHQLQASVGFVFVIDMDIEAVNGELFLNHQNSMVLTRFLKSIVTSMIYDILHWKALHKKKLSTKLLNGMLI
jgi:nucleotide-binding universal stress UspA family protein